MGVAMADTGARGSTHRTAKRKRKKPTSEKPAQPRKRQPARVSWFGALLRDASLGKNPKLRKTAIGVVYGVLATLFAAIVAFLSEVHLEISFDKLRQFKMSDVSSYSELFTAVTFAAELTTQQEFTAFWVDDDEGKQVVRSSDVLYKNFRLNNRMAGKLIDKDDRAVYSIGGFYNSNRLVFSHRGPISGTGVYILDIIRIDDVISPTYVGYSIMDNVALGSTEIRMLRCPFAMIDKNAAMRKAPDIESARRLFPALRESCAAFNMPGRKPVS